MALLEGLGADDGPGVSQAWGPFWRRDGHIAARSARGLDFGVESAEELVSREAGLRHEAGEDWARVNRTGGSGSRIARRAERAGIQLRPEVVQAFAAYLELLTVWNRKMNLTALGDEDAAIDRLLLEPVMALRFIQNDATGFLDVGSGAGSPAIPVKICMPWMRVWLVESKVRKSAFLLEVVRQLGLEQVVVETCRFEELVPREDIGRAVDLVTIRAVRMDQALWAALEGFVQPGASVFLFGGPAPRDRRGVPAAFEVRGDETLLEANGSRLVRLRRF